MRRCRLSESEDSGSLEAQVYLSVPALMTDRSSAPHTTTERRNSFPYLPQPACSSTTCTLCRGNCHNGASTSAADPSQYDRQTTRDIEACLKVYRGVTSLPTIYRQPLKTTPLNLMSSPVDTSCASLTAEDSSIYLLSHSDPCRSRHSPFQHTQSVLHMTDRQTTTTI